ncbi:chloride channel protein, partial [Pycnococcus provasolii]
MVGSTFVFTVALFVPQILFFGYYGVDNALQGVEPIALAGAKIAVTSVCAGSGLVGGVFAPSLFIGSAIGASFGSVLNILEPPTGLDIVAGSPAYALVGMASLLAAT